MGYKKTFIYFFLFTLTFVCNGLFSQEKRDFLLHRNDIQGEIITKKSSKYDLEIVKNRLERMGVVVTFSNLKYNSKKEIVRISIKLKNAKSKFSSKWNQKNTPIPQILLGEVRGIVTIQTTFKNTNFKLIEN